MQKTNKQTNKKPCSKTTNEKGKGEGGNHTNEISILKFRFRKLKKITLVSMFRACKVLM